VVICLERGADLHMAQLMPLPLTVSCFSKVQTGFTFLVPAHQGSPGKGPLNGCVCVCGISWTIRKQSAPRSRQAHGCDHQTHRPYCTLQHKFKLASLAFKAMHTDNSPYLSRILISNCPSRVLASSFSANLFVSSSHKSYLRFSLFPCSCPNYL